MSPRPLTDFAIDRLIRRDVAWVKTAELYLWKDHFEPGVPRAVSLFLSDATRYLPAATVVDPLYLPGSGSGPLVHDGEGWLTPAGWDGLSIVTTSGGPVLQATLLNAGGGPNGGNIQLIGVVEQATNEMFGAVTITVLTNISDTTPRWGGVVLCAVLDGSSYYGCVADHSAANVYSTTIFRYAAGTRTNLVQVPTLSAAWVGRRLYAETRHVGTGLQITIRCGGPAAPIFAQVVDPTPLTGLYAGPTIFIAAGNQNQIMLTTPMVGVSRREYLGAVLKWGQMGDAVEALKPSSAASSLDLDVSDALAMQTTEIAPNLGTVRTYPRLSAMVNDSGVDGVDIGASGILIRWVPQDGILGASNYRLGSPLKPADDVLLHIGLFDNWKVNDRDVVTLSSTSAEGIAYVRVDQAAVANAPVGLVTPIDWHNGFEEGQLLYHNASDQYSIWSFVTGSSPGIPGTPPLGVNLVPGIHGASQYAVRFTADGNTLSGGTFRKDLPGNLGDGTTLYGRGYYRSVSVPSGSGSGGVRRMRIVQCYNSAVAGSLTLYWLPGGGYQMWNQGQNTTINSTYPMGSLDRVEWCCTRGVAGVGGGCELRIFSGDSRVPRETLVLPGDPGGNLQAMVWQMQQEQANMSGAYELDDVAISTQGWIGPGCTIIAVPSAAVSTQWVPSSGTNVSCIDDHPGPIDDTNYISTATAGATDQYQWSIPAAPAVPDGALFYRAVIMMRGGSVLGTTRQVVPVIWDELGNPAVGQIWGTPLGPTNPRAAEYSTFAPAGRSLAEMQHWSIGLQCVVGGADTIRITLLYANLEYFTG